MQKESLFQLEASCQGAVHITSTVSGLFAASCIRARCQLAVLILLLVSMANGPSLADNISWQDATGDWFNASNWIDYSRTDGKGNYLNLVPGSADSVTVANGGSPQIAGNAGATILNISSGSSLSLGGGSLTAAKETIGNFGTGVVTQTGGTNNVGNELFLGAGASSGNGSYSLSGEASSLTINNSEYVGYDGTGNFTQNGGKHTVGGGLFLGNQATANGTYTLSGAASSLTVNGGAEFVGEFGTGEFLQNGGTHTIALFLSLGNGSSGTGFYTLSGAGSLTASGEVVGDEGTGKFIQNGGTNTVGRLTLGNQEATANGTYILSGAASSLTVNSEEVIGSVGTGMFTQTGGTNNVGDELFLGAGASSGNGSYSLSGEASSLTINNSEYVGYDGTGTFTQNGGTHTVSGPLYLGVEKGSTAYYTLSGTGSLTVMNGNDEWIGDGGTGTFTQNGGTHTVSRDLALGIWGTGFYTLSETGSLTVNGFEYIGSSGAGTFTQNGGKHTVTGTLTLVANSGASGTYNMNGGTLTAGAITINNGGTFTNSASITLTGTPGTAATSGGSFTQNASGTLNVQINGTGDGQFGQLFVGQANLAGNLSVTLGSNYNGTTLPTHDSIFQIISTAAGQTSGTFNSGHKVVVAKFAANTDPYYNGGFAGIFDVNYIPASNGGVTLSHFHQIHVLSFGYTSDDSRVDGEVGAQHVHDAFKQLPGLTENIVLKRDSSTAGIDNYQAFVTQIKGMQLEGIRAGDTYVFYINTHGQFDRVLQPLPSEEGIITRQYEGTWPLYLDTSYESNSQTCLEFGDNPGSVKASIFAGLFSDSAWTTVNKLFIMDMCYAGGFWTGTASVVNGTLTQHPYLSAIPKTGFIGAARESELSLGDSKGGQLGQGLVDVLGQVVSAGDDLTYASLLMQLNATTQARFHAQNGWAQDYISNQGGPANPLPFVDNMMSDATSDFEFELVGSGLDPNSLAFLALSAITQNWLTNVLPGTSGDFTGDGFVNFLDFAILASQWPTGTPPQPPSDTNMVLIPTGTFQMGDSLDGESDALPVHTVTLSSFYMDKYDITNQQYCSFLNSAAVKVIAGVVYASTDYNNSFPYCYTSVADTYSQIAYSGGVFSVRTKGSRSMVNDPMIDVTWYGAAAYCNWRSQQEGRGQCYDLSTWTCDFTKNGYHLPTEAQWEYAARGGLSGNRFPWGDVNTISHGQANYYNESGDYSYDLGPPWGYDPTWSAYGIWPYTSPVGSFPANGYGLYDMAGNVWQWCNDWYGSYSSGSQTNPTGPTSGSWPVLRGGSWDEDAYNCRVADRAFDVPYDWDSIYGFRLALNLN